MEPQRLKILCIAGTLFQLSASSDVTHEYAKKYEGPVMAGSEESVVGYRCNAAHCIELAQGLPKTEAKLVLLDMAQAWLRLADLAEKFAETVVVQQT